MRVDLRGRNCWQRKTEKKVVGQSKSGSPGGGTIGGGSMQSRGTEVNAILY